MMNKGERAKVLEQMQAGVDGFYAQAVQIGVHPFIEFCGLMNQYIKACRQAHGNGVDFSECNKHSGRHLPLESFEIAYINEKLECIFTGRIVMSESADIKYENPDASQSSRFKRKRQQILKIKPVGEIV